MERWRKNLELDEKKRLFTEQDAKKDNSTEHAKQGLYLTERLKWFLVEWSHSRSEKFKTTTQALWGKVMDDKTSNTSASKELIRSIVDAAASLLYAGGDIPADVIAEATANVQLSELYLLQETKEQMQDLAGEDDTEDDNSSSESVCTRLLKLEEGVLQRLGVDRFEALGRGSFVKFLASHEKDASLTWLRAFGTSSNEPARLAVYDDDATDDVVLHAPSAEVTSLEGTGLEDLASVVKREAMQLSLGAHRGHAISMWDARYSMFQRMAQLETAVCEQFGVAQFSDLQPSARTLTDFLASLLAPAANQIEVLLTTCDVPRLCEVVQALRLLQAQPGSSTDYEATLAELFEIKSLAHLGPFSFVVECAQFVDELVQTEEDQKSRTGFGTDGNTASRGPDAHITALHAAVLCPLTLGRVSSARAGGATIEQITLLISTIPLLQPLSFQSLWSDAFAPDHGSLSELCHSLARKDVDLDFLHAGSQICRIDAAPHCDKLRQAAASQRDPNATAGQLVSLCKSQHGVHNMSVRQIHTVFKQSYEPLSPNAACRFVFETLAAVPNWGGLRASLAPLMLEPLAGVLGSAAAMENQLVRTFAESHTPEETEVMYCLSGYASGSKQCLRAYLGALIPAACNSSAAEVDHTQQEAGTVVATTLNIETNAASLCHVASEPAPSRTSAFEEFAKDETNVSTTQEATQLSDTGVAAPQKSMSATTADAKKVIDGIRGKYMMDAKGVWADTTKNALVRLSVSLAIMFVPCWG